MTKVTLTVSYGNISETFKFPIRKLKKDLDVLKDAIESEFEDHSDIMELFDNDSKICDIYIINDQDKKTKVIKPADIENQWKMQMNKTESINLQIVFSEKPVPKVIVTSPKNDANNDIEILLENYETKDDEVGLAIDWDEVYKKASNVLESTNVPYLDVPDLVLTLLDHQTIINTPKKLNDAWEKNKQKKKTILIVVAVSKSTIKHGILPIPIYEQNTSGTDDKIVLIIGETGTGKTTLINSMMNYLFDVKQNDLFRYKLPMKEEDEETEGTTQASSQTSKVHPYYCIRPNHNIFKYNLTLIDTPGYGDTRGIKEDKETTSQIKDLFETRIQSVHAVCLVVRAPQVRLSSHQKFVFDEILSLFGNDIKNNIFILITFYDGQKPLVLEAIKAHKIPYKQYFVMNNGAFFAGFGEDEKNDDIGNSTDSSSNNNSNAYNSINLSEMNKSFWKLSISSFKSFCNELERIQPISLENTKLVLQQRDELQKRIKQLRESMTNGLSCINQFTQQIICLKKNKKLVDKNRNFTLKVARPERVMQVLPKGQYANTCSNCGRNACHVPCNGANNLRLLNYFCSRFDWWGNCKMCGCGFGKHVCLGYIYKTKTVVRTTTFDKLKKKYCKHAAKHDDYVQIVTGIMGELMKARAMVLDTINGIKDNVNKIEEVALKSNILTTNEYIDELIEQERMNKSEDWKAKITMYESLKADKDYLKEVMHYGNEYDPFKDTMVQKLLEHNIYSADIEFIESKKTWWSRLCNGIKPTSGISESAMGRYEVL